MSNASLRTIRRGLCTTFAVPMLVLGSLAPAFAAEPVPVATEGPAVVASTPQTAAPIPAQPSSPVATGVTTVAAPAPSPGATIVATVAVAPPSGTAANGESPSPTAAGGSLAVQTPTSAPPPLGTVVVTTAVATATDAQPPASPTVDPPSATPTPAAQSGSAEALAGAEIQQYNIQIIQGTPNPTAPIAQDASNNIVANQRAAATSGVATAAGTAADGTLNGSALAEGTPIETPDGTVASGGVVAVAAAVIRQINVQIITAYSGESAITQSASNSVVLTQDVAAQSGNAVSLGAGSGVDGDAKASALTSQTQASTQIYVGTGPLTADEVIRLVTEYLNGTTAPNAAGANVTQTTKDKALITQSVSAAVRQAPTLTPGTGAVASVASNATSSPPAPTPTAVTGASGTTIKSAMTGDALITALVFVGQINVQLISGLFGNGLAVQSASNTLTVDQTLAASSGSASAANGGSAKSGEAAINARFDVDQLTAQVTLTGVGEGALAAARSQDDVISAIINVLFNSAASSTYAVTRQQAASAATVQQDLRIPRTPTPKPTSPPDSGASGTATPGPNLPPAADSNPSVAQIVLGARTCQFEHGFRTLHDAIPSVVGDCRTDETYALNGDSVQLTTLGILVWRKADNFTAFTNGRDTWVLGPKGIEKTAVTTW